jgi:hypothetical protein
MDLIPGLITFQLGLGFLESSKSFHMRMNDSFPFKSSMAAPCGAFITNWNTPICQVLHSKLRSLFTLKQDIYSPSLALAVHIKGIELIDE